MKKIFFMLLIWGFGNEDAFCQLPPLKMGIRENPVAMLPFFFAVLALFIAAFSLILLFKNKKLSNLLKAQNRKNHFYQTLLDQSPYMSFFKDKDLYYTDCNEKMALEFNLTKNNIIGKKAEEIFDKTLTEMIRIKDLTVLKNLKTIDEELVVRINKQNNYYHFILAAVLDESQKKVLGLTGFLKNITLKKRAFNLLIESEKRFKDTFECASSAIAHVDFNGNILKVNDEGCKILGYKKEELISKNIKDLNREEDYPKAEKMIKQFKNKEIDHFELDKPYIKKDGSLIWAHVSVSSVLDEFEKPSYLIAVFFNIDAQKKYEQKIKNLNEELDAKVKERNKSLQITLEELKKSEQRYKKMFETNHAVMLLVSPDSGQIKYANRSAALFYGYTQKELCKLKIWDLNVLSEEQVLMKMYAAKKDQKHFFQFKHKCFGGQIKDVEVYSGPISIKGETLLFSIIHDVSEQVKMKDYVRFFFEVSIDMLSVFDLNGQFLQLSPSWHAALGYSLSELTLKPIIEYIHEKDRSIFLKALNRLSKKEKINDLELRFRCKDNSYKWLSFNLAIILEKNLILAAARDISYHKEVEKALIYSKYKAQEANRSKGLFLANISHEFKTPLNAIMGFSDLLSHTKLDETQKEYLNSIQRASSNVLTLINDILDLSKIEAGKLDIFYTPLSLKELFDNLKQIFSLKANEKKLNFKLELEEDFPELILSDQARLRQILFNLIGNAIKFTEHGFVYVRAEAIALDSKKELYNIKIRVEDSGIGISLKAQKEVFKAFSQENSKNRVAGGTGLGLSISQNLAKMLNGFIDLQSSKDLGSLFTLNLNSVKAIQRLSPISSENTQNSFKSFKEDLVLLCIQNEKTRSLLESTLKSWNLKSMHFDRIKKILEYQNLPHASLIILETEDINTQNELQNYKSILLNKKLSHIHKILMEPAAFSKEDIKQLFDHQLQKPLNIKDLYEICSLYFALNESKNKLNVKNWFNNLKKSQKISLLNKLFLLLEDVKHLKGALHIAKVKKLALNLEALASEYKSFAMDEYAKTLLLASENYDIQSLMQTLNAFFDIKKELENEH